MRRSKFVLMLVAVMLAVSGATMWGSGGARAAIRSVDAWIQVSSVSPGVGCPIDVSVEIREQGHPVAAASVEIALHIDGELYSADHASTDSSGIAYLALDTSASPSGVGHWVDVNVGGQYLKGFSVVPTAGGGCSENGKLITVSGDINYSESSEVSVSSAASNAWVPAYQQQRNLSCEFAALYIATAAWGNGISEYAFEEAVGYSPNPHWGYRGNIHGLWGNTTDYGVYAQPLSWALDSFGFYGDDFFAAGDASQLTSRLDAGIPVLVWIAMWGDQSHYETTDGATYKLVAGMHVMVAYAYDDSGVYLSDPGTGTYRSYAWGDFMAMWNILDGMGLGVSPY